jgi:hypothetical protein
MTGKEWEDGVKSDTFRNSDSPNPIEEGEKNEEIVPDCFDD